MVLFGVSWYSPAGHAAHSDWLLLVVMVPGAHGVGAVEPVAHAEPAGHGLHSLSDCRLVLLEYEPALHGRGMELPSGQKWASGQGTASMVLALGQ